MVVVGLAVAVATGGCASLHNLGPALSEIVTDLTDAAQILDIAASIANIFFLSHPNPDAEIKVHKALVTAHLGLDTATRLTSGVKDLSHDKEDAAFADFRLAYGELAALLRQFGVVQMIGTYQRLAVRDGSFLTLPDPIVVLRSRRAGS